jgi:hypothetical protein
MTCCQPELKERENKNLGDVSSNTGLKCVKLLESCQKRSVGEQLHPWMMAVPPSCASVIWLIKIYGADQIHE